MTPIHPMSDRQLRAAIVAIAVLGSLSLFLALGCVHPRPAPPPAIHPPVRH